jgi:AcrR family transcriptional regulator
VTGAVSPGSTGRDRLLSAAIAHFAAAGIADTSLRGLATRIGTSHRMLIYHFGSREGLLSAVVGVVEAAQRETLARLAAAADGDPVEQARRFWHEVADAALIYGPLFFELSGHAMQGLAHAGALRADLIGPWLDQLAELGVRAGADPGSARTAARLQLAVARGLLFDLLLSGDRAGVDAAMELFTSQFRPGGPGTGS